MIEGRTFWLAISVLTAIPPYLNYSSGYFVQDLAETIYHGRAWAEGMLPYRDVFSHHFLGYVIPFWLIEISVGLSPLSVALMQWVYQFIVIAFIFKTTLLITKSAPASHIGALCAAAIGWYPAFFGTTFNYQSYSLPLVSVLIYLLIASKKKGSPLSDLGSSLAAGLLIIGDQRFLIFVIMFIPSFWRLGLGRSIAFILTPCLLCVAAPLLYLAVAGAWDDFIQQTVLFPLLYRNATMEVAGIWQSLSLLQSGFYFEPIIGVGIIGIAALVVREKDAATSCSIALWLVASIAYVIMGGRHFPNYLIIPALPVLFGIALIPHYLLSSSRSRVLQWASIASVMFLGGLQVWRTVTISYRAAEAGELKQIAASVAEHSAADEKILVWGYCPQIYILSRRFSGFRDMGLITIAGGLFHLAESGDENVWPDHLANFKDFLRISPPSVIVAAERLRSIPNSKFAFGCTFSSPDEDRAAGFNFVRSKLGAEYRVVHSIADDEYLISVFERNSS